MSGRYCDLYGNSYKIAKEGLEAELEQIDDIDARIRQRREYEDRQRIEYEEKQIQDFRDFRDFREWYDNLSIEERSWYEGRYEDVFLLFQNKENKMDAEQFKKFIKDNKIEWQWEKRIVHRLDEQDVMIFVNLKDLPKLTSMLSYNFFDKNKRLTCVLKHDYVAIWASDILGIYGIPVEEIFPEEEE